MRPIIWGKRLSVILVLLGFGLIAWGILQYYDASTVLVAEKLGVKMRLDIWRPHGFLEEENVQVQNVSLVIDAVSLSRSQAELTIWTESPLPPLILTIPHRAEVVSTSPRPNEWQWPLQIEFTIPRDFLPESDNIHKYDSESDTTRVYLNWTDWWPLKEYVVAFWWEPWDLKTYEKSRLSVPMYVDKGLVVKNYEVTIYYTAGEEDIDFSSTNPQPSSFSTGWAEWSFPEFDKESPTPISGPLSPFFEQANYARSKAIAISVFSPNNALDKDRSIFFSGVLIAIGSSVVVEVSVGELRKVKAKKPGSPSAQDAPGSQ